MRLVEATFDWHMNPIDYESVAGNNDYDKITNFKYPRMKVVAQGSIDSGSGGGTLNSAITFEIGDLVYRKDGTILADITSHTGTNSTLVIHALDMNSITYEDEIYVIRQKLFSTLADNDFGIDTIGTNPFRMLNNYIALPNIAKDYFEFKLLKGDSNNKFDAQNVWIPLISSLINDGSNFETK